MKKFAFLPKSEILKLPKGSGVYVFKGGGKFFYIGKAANIRERVKNHFQGKYWWEKALLRQGFEGRVGYIKTDSEIEAFLLEAKLIKKYQPKFNVVWRDDKNYFYVGITKEKFPRVFITHQPAKIFASQKLKRASQKLKIDYEGPFTDGTALKQTLKILKKVFPYRSCRVLPKSPCLWYQLDRCPAPCLMPRFKDKPRTFFATAKNVRGYKKNIRNLLMIIKGQRNWVMNNLKKEMKKAAKNRDFETAAKIRDQIFSLEKIIAHSKIFSTPLTQELMPLPQQWHQLENKLKKIFGVKNKISRIEAYDISNIQGQQATGSMITFINGSPDKNLYRRFKIKISGKPNDTAMLKEVLVRRLSHNEWRYPDLILIDGGISQLNAGLKIKNKNFKIKNIKIVSLAKKENKLYIEGKQKPVLLKSLSREVFNLILQLRDEAHRFAKKYHLKLREKNTLT